MNKIKLSICLPTYNRSKKAIEQLKFLENELKKLENESDIEIIVSDNNSKFEEANNLKKFLEKKEIKLNYNLKNLGLVGNLKKLLDLSKGKYIWFVGDDDILEPGILKLIYTKLKDCDFLFINHDAFINSEENIVMKSAIPEILNKENVIEQVFEYSKTTLMFITACIYKRNKLEEVMEKLSSLDLSDPLVYSIYCGKDDNVAVIKEIMIHNKWGDTSWSSQSSRVFLEEIPKKLRSLYKLNIDKQKQKKLLIEYCRDRKYDLIKYNLKRGRIKDIVIMLKYLLEKV